MKLILSGTIESLNSRNSDHSWVLKIATQELTSGLNELNELMKSGGFCKILLSNGNITNVEAELVESTGIVKPKGKTPSARLRAVLYRVWENEGGDVEFETWYASKMETLIQHFKDKLD